MDIISSTLITVATLNFLLGFSVWSREYKKRANIFFMLIGCSVGVWSLCIYFFRMTNSFYLLDIFASVTYISAAATTFFFAYFCLFFYAKLEKQKNNAIQGFLLGSFGIISSLLLFTDFIIEDVVVRDTVNGLVFGSLYPLYGIYLFSIFVLGLWILFEKHKGASKNVRAQMKYIFIGTLISLCLAIFTNFILFGRGLFRYNWLGPVSTLVMVVFIAYAITKHHLFDIKLIATEILVSLVTIVLFIDLLLADGPWMRIFKGAIFVAFIYLGWSLVKSVLQEIRRREKMEKMAQDLSEAYLELRKVDKAKSEFIAMASHQLRTPLTVVKGLTSMIQEGTYGEPPEELEEPLKDIFNSNERLIRLVNDLLDISKVDLGKVELDKERINLNEIVESVVEELEKEAEKKDLKVRWEKKESFPKIIGDAIKIRQCIFNIIDNAIKYTTEGRIEIKLKDLDEKVRLEVTDTGEGLTEDEAEEIFSSFTRGAAGLKYSIQGTGLGLYLARKYVELHGGEVWAESEGKGKGSTFYLTLPKKESRDKKSKKGGIKQN